MARPNAPTADPNLAAVTGARPWTNHVQDHEDLVLEVNAIGATIAEAIAGYSTLLEKLDSIGGGSVDGTAVGGDLSGTLPNPSLAGTANVEDIIRSTTLDQMGAPGGAVNFNNQRQVNLGDPIYATDGVPKSYVDGAITVVGDANYSILATDRTLILTTALTASRTLTLPLANTCTAGQEIRVVDATGSLDYSSHSLIVAIQGSDTMVGTAFALGFAVHTGGYGVLVFKTNGSDKWYCEAIESVSNKDQSTALGTSGVKYPSQAAVKGYVDSRTAPNVTTVSDANYTALATDNVIAYTALTASRTVTLPAANSVRAGFELNVVDATGAVDYSTNAIFVAKAGSDTIPGVGVGFVLHPGPFGSARFKSDGVSKWYVIALETASSKDPSTSLGSSDVKYPTQKAVKTYVDAAKADAISPAIVTLGDADATIAATTRVAILTTALTANRTLTLPSCATAGLGWTLTIIDATGSTKASGNYVLSITRAGSDTIDGALGSTLTWLGGPYDQKTFRVRDASRSGKWVQSTAELQTNKEVSTITSGDQNKYASSDAVLNATAKFTNKRIKKRVNSTASSATPAINTDTTDLFKITALATNITSMTSSLTGTPDDGDELIVRIKDNGTSRTITWGASFASYGATLPTATTVNKTHTIRLIWDSVAAVWCCILAVVQP